MGEKVSFASNGSTCEGYLSLPASDSGPAVIVIQEWWGLVGHITAVADRFAREGFVALAPDLYHGVAATEPDHAMKLMMGLAMDKAALDIAGAAKYLDSRVDVTGKGIGAVGFCMGGSLHFGARRWHRKSLQQLVSIQHYRGRVCRHNGKTIQARKRLFIAVNMMARPVPQESKRR